MFNSVVLSIAIFYTELNYKIYNWRNAVEHIPIYTYFIHITNFFTRPRHCQGVHGWLSDSGWGRGEGARPRAELKEGGDTTILQIYKCKSNAVLYYVTSISRGTVLPVVWAQSAPQLTVSSECKFSKVRVSLFRTMIW